MPVPRMRVTARGGHARAYPHPAYVKWLGEAGRWFEGACAHTPLESLLMVDLFMFVEKPKTGKLLTPRGDVDNFCKGPLDAANGKVWVDDNQIVELRASKEYVPHGTPGFFIMNVSEVD